MAKIQKSYAPEFKQQIVDLHCKAGKGVTELSNEYGIPKGTISTMDLYVRKIIGWSYGKKITAELATKAVRNACLNIPDTNGILLNRACALLFS